MEPPVEIANPADELMATNVTRMGNLLYHEDADGPSLFSSGLSIQTATSYGITMSTAQHYNGTKSIRFELRDTDPMSHSGTRAEISNQECTNLNRWYSFALYAPAAQYKSEVNDDVISQWHQGGSITPSLCMRVKGDRLYLRVLAKTWDDLGVFEKNKWHAYVLHVKHSPNSDGSIEIWRDGKKIFSRTGPNMHPVTGDLHNPNWKFGIYKAEWNGTGTSDTKLRVLYFDDVKMGNEKATYNEMVPVKGGSTAGDNSSSISTPVSPVNVAPGIVGFYLVNSATEKDVMPISNGQTISLSALNITKANIRAATTTNSATVKFELTGTQSKIYFDKKAPYALHGDDGNGNFYYGNWNPPALGTYSLKAATFTSSGIFYQTGPSKTITFTITK